MKMNKVLGYNYFHTHPKMEKMLKVDNDHVIIDKNEYYEVLESLKNSTELVLPQQPSPQSDMSMKDNKIELLKEDLECVHKYLDDINAPRADKDGKVYSIVGRIIEALSTKAGEFTEQDMVNFMDWFRTHPENENIVSSVLVEQYREQRIKEQK